MLAIMLAGHLRVLRDRPVTDAQRLGACLMVQAGALVIAATALAVQGPAQVVFWLAMGVAVVVSGRWIGSRGLDVYGLIVLSLATARTLVWESWSGTLPRGGVEFSGLYLTWWAALTGAVGGGWIAIAWLLRRSAAPASVWRSISTVAVAVGMSLFLVALQHAKASVLVPLVTAATMGLAVVVVGRALGSAGLKGYGVLMLAGSGV